MEREQDENEVRRAGPRGDLAADILRGVLDPLLTLDHDLRVRMANPAFYELFSLTPEQTLGQPIYEIGGGLWSAPHLRELLKGVVEHDKTFRNYEFTHEFETIGRRTVLLSASRLESSGNDELVLLAMKDITRRKQAEEILRENEQQLRMIFKNAKEFAIIGMDLEGRVTAWNPGAERLLGYSESEIMGQDARIIFTRIDVQRGVADYELRTALEEGRAENERWHVRKDGSRFWGSGIVTPLYIGDEPQGLMKIMRDMTAEHQLREEREAKAEELERRVDEASTELEERARQLEALNRHLYQAELRERQRLAQVLHDDLQQLLVALDMRLQMAEKPLTQNDADEARHVQQARELARQAIDTSRTLSHELSPTVLREQGLVPALHWLSENIEERHELPVHVDADEPTAESLPEDMAAVLFQMVRELLFNVVKHAEAKQAWVKLDAVNGGQVRLSVDDDGRGCDPNIISGGDEEKIGLGLSAIRDRVRIWRGQVRGEQRPGGGCRIVLDFSRSLGM